jgi:1,4-alpha-glucan branching enzyme
VRVFRPLDQAADLLLGAGDQVTVHPMTKVHPQGFFEVLLPGESAPVAYRLRLHDAQGGLHEIEDPYRFPPVLTDFELYLHGEGNFFQSYEKLGAHFATIDGVAGVHFAVWAPNAQRVSVIGPFNGWDNRTHPMQMGEGVGIWQLFIPHLEEGTSYKFSIKSRFMGYEVDKSDPYGFYAELRPSTASRIWDLNKYEWHDQEWVAHRAAVQALNQPVNIYEVHLASWRRVPEDNGYLSYRDLAHQLVDYVTQMGYTHVELLPITEYPFDGSWGYQAVGYFAPTSRFGSPDDFMYFVDYCHQHNVGVILDWVPAHFPRDAHGLGYFDGTHLYEHADPRQGEHLDWGTKIFNYGRNEVRNFLLSSALFWLKQYHLDGLRVDAVASMLYLDYSREGGDWLPNKYGGRENLEAIDFLRKFNELVHQEAPGALTFAEESTSWPMVTRPTYAGGLGFDFKWNMGWMHDMLKYMSYDPIHRRYYQNQITFSMIYAFSENFVLPLSHDEVVHLKKSMLNKMPGDRWQQFANLRALYAYMTSHPGKKLLFMGGEFGQGSEWNEARSLDWHLLQYDEHRQLQAFVAALNHLYQREPALYEVDSSWEGFMWIDFSDADQSVVSFARRAANPADLLVIVCNFTPVPRLGYRVGLPAAARYREILNSDWPQFGGSGVANEGEVVAESLPWQNCGHSAPFNLPPLGVIILKPEGSI